MTKTVCSSQDMCPLVAGKGDGHGGSVGLSDGEGRGYGRARPAETVRFLEGITAERLEAVGEMMARCAPPSVYLSYLYMLPFLSSNFTS